jgi:hypothetical protein
MKKTFLLLVAFVFFGVIVFAGTLRITSPNGGENWQIGTPQTITWEATGSFTNNVKLTLFKDGARLGPIANNLNPFSGRFLWDKAGEYHEGHGGGPLRTASAGTKYTIKIKEQDVATSDTSDGEFTLSAPHRDLTVTDIYKDRLNNLVVRVKCLSGSYSGWCLLRVENPNIPISSTIPVSGARTKMHNLNLRSGMSQTYTLGAFTPDEWIGIFRAEGQNPCMSANFTAMVDANNQIPEANENNNSFRKRVFLHDRDVQIVLPVRIGKSEREARSHQEFIVRPDDVESRDGEYIVLQFKVTVRNCGYWAFGGSETKVLKFMDVIEYPEGVYPWGTEQIEVGRAHVGGRDSILQPGETDTVIRKIRFRFQVNGSTASTILFWIHLPNERGTADANNHVNRIKLKFVGF